MVVPVFRTSISVGTFTILRGKNIMFNSRFDGFRAIRHDLLNNENAATLCVAGDTNATDIIFFCAGFPCDHASFKPLAKRIVTDNGWLVGVSCLPEFDKESPSRQQGYQLDEMSACLAQAVAALRAQSTNPSAALTIVVHDWAVIPGLDLYKISGCDKLVLFDVLPPAPNDRPDKWFYPLIHLNYQLMFATSFLISRWSERLAQLWLNVGSLIIFSVLGRWLNPVGPRTDGRMSWPLGSVGFLPWQIPDKEMAGSVKMTPYRCYPYYHMFKALLFNRGTMRALSEKLNLDGLIEEKPICFIFGEEKNTHFHSQAQLTKLRATPGCEVHGIPEAGHWCYKQQFEKCYQKVQAFVRARHSN